MARSPVSDCTDPIVNTYDALRTDVDITKCTSVKVLGKDSAFDGFGGIYVRQAQTTPAQVDNDADIILSMFSSAYYWKLWQ